MKIRDMGDRELAFARIWLKLQGFLVAMGAVGLSKLLDMIIESIGGPIWVRVIVFAMIVIMAIWFLVAIEDRRQ